MNLKEFRKFNNLKQEDIAKMLNIKQATYSGYESGKYEPTIKTLIKLADFYKTSIDSLVGRNYKNDIGLLTPKQTASKLFYSFSTQFFISRCIIPIFLKQ